MFVWIFRDSDTVFLFLALQNQLVPLLGALPDQSQSVYALLEVLEQKVGC